MNIPFLDLRITNDVERQEILESIEKVFRHGRFIMGPEVQELESRMASFSQRTYAVGVNSGTDALFLALKSLGIGPGNEVITTSLSWVATANAIALTGARPIFADIRDDLNIDPDSVKKLITSSTKAILPVHYTGKVCQMRAITEIADTHGLFVVEDAAQAFGARYYKRLAGSFGTIACFSMNPMKVFAACGEAGMIVLDREDLYKRLVALRYNGAVNREECIEASLNGRIDTVQAAVLLNRLKYVEDIIKKRRQIASWYGELLKDVVQLPQEQEGERDIFYTYTIRTPKRDELKKFLQSRSIETKIQHPYLMPQQPAYREGVRGEFLNAEKLVKQILCIPANEKLNRKEIEYVAESIKEFFERPS